MSRLVYVCAPYGATTHEERERNVARALGVAQVLAREGWCPVCLHPAIHAGVYGDDSDPAQREAGLRVAVRTVEEVVRGQGLVAVLLRDDGEMSPGTAMEWLAARRVAATWTGRQAWDPDRPLLLSGTWETWQRRGATDAR